MSKCTCAFPCGGTDFQCPSSPEFGQETADQQIAALKAEVAELKLQLQPRSVREVISFAHVEAMSPRQLSDVLTAQYTELVELRRVVKLVGEAFDGGPKHPWIPGGNASPIYPEVMAAISKIPGEKKDCTCIRQVGEPHCTDCPTRR